MLTEFYHAPAIDFQAMLDQALELGEQIKPMLTDVGEHIYALNAAGSNLLFEGAQGALLDIDHGTYPYVTSSNTTAGGAAPGSGIGPLDLDYVLRYYQSLFDPWSVTAPFRPNWTIHMVNT